MAQNGIIADYSGNGNAATAIIIVIHNPSGSCTAWPRSLLICQAQTIRQIIPVTPKSTYRLTYEIRENSCIWILLSKGQIRILIILFIPIILENGRFFCQHFFPSNTFYCVFAGLNTLENILTASRSWSTCNSRPQR